MPKVELKFLDVFTRVHDGNILDNDIHHYQVLKVSLALVLLLQILDISWLSQALTTVFQYIKN